jgi:ribosomal protein S4
VTHALTGHNTSRYKVLIDGRTDAMRGRYKDSTRADLLTALRRNQQAGRYLVAGDLAAIRSSLERGQTVKDLGKAALRKILDARFEYVVYEQRAGSA